MTLSPLFYKDIIQKYDHIIFIFNLTPGYI